MLRLLKYSLVLLVALITSGIPEVWAQSTTPNVGLYIPGHNSAQWDIPLNQNFNLLDQFLGGVRPIKALQATQWLAPAAISVATLLSLITPPQGSVASVVDGLNSTTCTQGGGNSFNFCLMTPSGWVSLGAGGGGVGLQSINNSTIPNQTIVGAGAVTVTTNVATGVTTIYVAPSGATATLSSITVSPATVLGGNPSTGTVTLSLPAPTGGALTTLSSSNTAIATVPASATVAEGSVTQTFPITTTAVTTPTNVTISGVYAGVTKEANLLVTLPQPIYGGPGQPGATTATLTGNTVTLNDSANSVLPQLQTTPEQVGQSWQFTVNNQVIYLVLFGSSLNFVDGNGFKFAFNTPIAVSIGTVHMYLYQSTNALFGTYTVKVAP